MPIATFSPVASGDDASGGSSAHNVSASYEFFGRAPYPGYSRGGRFGFIFNNRQELNLSYIRSEQNLLLTSYTYQEAALTLSFWFNSHIYFGIGAGQRTVTIDSQVFIEPTSNSEPSATHLVHEKYTMLTGNTTLGFEIRIFANLLIGAEIFGLSAPFHTLKKKSNFPDNAAEYEDDPKTYPYIRDGLKTNYHLLRTFIKVRL